MDYTTLKDEIQNDPENMGYGQHIDTGNHNAIVGLLQKDDPSGQVVYERLSSEKATRIAAEVDAYGAIKADAEDGTSSTQSQSLAAMDTLRKHGADFALHLQSMRDMLDALVQNGVLSDTQKAAFTNESKRTARREEAVLGQGVSVDHTDVAKALS